MASGFQWEKARQRDAATKHRRNRPPKRLRHEKRQAELASFAMRHDITCFNCKRGRPAIERWAASGFSKARKPWIVCSVCISDYNHRTTKRPAREDNGPKG